MTSELQHNTGGLASGTPNGPRDLVNGSENGHADGPTVVNGIKNEIEIVCGPLLNYKGMKGAGPEASVWRGSVLIVAKPGQQQPELGFYCRGPWKEGLSSAPGHGETSGGQADLSGNTAPKSSFERKVPGVKLYEDSVKTFWRFDIDVPFQEYEACWDYSLKSTHFFSAARPRSSSTHTFVVPSASQSMRMMFHSCNGFSVGTDEEAWSGTALWNDVLRSHEQRPFHVMIGGGDQIYNDSVRVTGPLKPWTAIANPKRRREYPFDEALRDACDSFYFENYAAWYAAEPFASANRQIPQVNIWDDHGMLGCSWNSLLNLTIFSDIIDGFGSYTDHFMKCDVFRGIGDVSFKYYCLFQHHIPPSRSTFTISAPQTMNAPDSHTSGADPAQLKDTTVYQEPFEDPCFIMGARPGPYIPERSRSLYMRLGAHVAFLGLDARTERTRHQVNYPETYDLVFERMRSEFSAAGKGGITHLILLLGVPIAYPRLIWLENIFTSPIIGPIRFLSKRFGIAGGLFNHFNGQVDLLDDLDDHYTARHHKHERKELMLRLQALAQDHNIRVTILGGDVHLGAVGRFYSNPKLGIPIEQDHRYMSNVISSAITNAPPPKTVADFLARRNKIHHLDHDTDETLMKIFDKDPGNVSKSANFNKVTMPRRNYAIISESPSLGGSPEHVNPIQANGQAPNGDAATPVTKSLAKGRSNDGHRPLHSGEEDAGTKHPAANGGNADTMPGGLDVCLQVEIDQHDKQGKTEGYGFHSKSGRTTRFIVAVADWL